MHRRRASPSLPAPAHHVPSTSRGMLPAQPAPLQRSQPTPRQLHRQRESPWAPILWSGLQAPSPARHPSGCAPLLPQHRDMPCAGHCSPKQPVGTTWVWCPQMPVTSCEQHWGPQGKSVAPCMSGSGDRDTHPAREARVPQTHSSGCANPLQPPLPRAGLAGGCFRPGHFWLPHPHPAPQGVSCWEQHSVPWACAGSPGSEQRPGWNRDGLARGRSRGHIPTRASPAVPARLGWPWGDAPVRLCSGEESG